MKEFKRPLNNKKKPGQFKKSKQRNKNIQHNRDQIKLLKEDKIEFAELFILDSDAFKKVTIKSEITYSPYGVVYLSHNGKKSKLRTGIISDIKLDDRINIDGKYIDPQYCFGTVIKVEILKAKESIN